MTRTEPVSDESALARASIPQDAQAVLYHVGLYYAADPERRDVEYWVSEKGEGKVTLEQATWWASKRDWAGLRRKFWYDFERQFLKGAVSKLALQRLREMERLEVIAGALYRFLTPDEKGNYRVQPRSYEGLVMAFKAISEHLGERRNELLGQLGDRPALPPGHIPSFTADQVAALAKAALDMRRAQLDSERRTDPVPVGPTVDAQSERIVTSTPPPPAAGDPA